MEEVIEGGPWLYLGQPIVLQKWEPGMVLRKLKHTEVPVWIKLRHLPVELWMAEGLSTVASGIGRPLYPDAITRTCTRLDFTRVCVMLHVSSKLPKYVIIMMPNELGGESAYKVDVEYEWLPPKCTGCSSLGHSLKECPLSKPTKPVVLHSNATRIQSGVLARWRWFMDYAGPGLNELAETVGNEPWLVGGDFSAVLDLDLDRRSLWKRLDRLLVNDVWMDRWPNMYYSCLTPRTSDHSPLVLKGDCRNLQVSLFRFDNYLALSPGFLESVHSIGGTLLLLVYLKASKLEQVMLKQRTKMQWLKGGDQCSRVFFRRVATRRANKRVFQIADDNGNEQTDPTIISSIFVDFFQGGYALGESLFAGDLFFSPHSREGHLPSDIWVFHLFQHRFRLQIVNHCFRRLTAVLKGGKESSCLFAGRVQLIKSVLTSFEVYWAMAFILPKGIIKEIIKLFRTFLWKGTSASGYPKVAWETVCRPIEEGGLGIKDILAINRALMSKHLWVVIKQDRTSIWVDWIIQVRLRDCSIWTVKENKGAWGWRKMLSLRHPLMSHIHYQVGRGDSISLWHDPWHPLGPLISRFPSGTSDDQYPNSLTSSSTVIKEGSGIGL
ncbi:hypothetical protein Sango_3078600 [Sesamum angolense]|uniref:DUF4283 domain-containing protein n=1 Tax=Sesamum angolense TaxID=2727404 RepID=A0AAE1T926_9LAMI|nr:hypothetical protein Sango_3078600 [Sesamum angolense]